MAAEVVAAVRAAAAGAPAVALPCDLPSDLEATLRELDSEAAALAGIVAELRGATARINAGGISMIGSSGGPPRVSPAHKQT